MDNVEKSKDKFLEMASMIRQHLGRPNLFALLMESVWGHIADISENYETRLSAMTKERDDIQLRLHAIDHAYSEQQRSENKLILEQQETIRRQRQFIRTLYTSRKARKAKSATRIQSDSGNAPKSNSGGNTEVSEGNLKRANVVRQQEGLRSGQVGCNGEAEMHTARCQHEFRYLHQQCVYCGERK